MTALLIVGLIFVLVLAVFGLPVRAGFEVPKLFVLLFLFYFCSTISYVTIAIQNHCFFR